MDLCKYTKASAFLQSSNYRCLSELKLNFQQGIVVNNCNLHGVYPILDLYLTSQYGAPAR